MRVSSGSLSPLNDWSRILELSIDETGDSRGVVECFLSCVRRLCRHASAEVTLSNIGPVLKRHAARFAFHRSSRELRHFEQKSLPAHCVLHFAHSRSLSADRKESIGMTEAPDPSSRNTQCVPKQGARSRNAFAFPRRCAPAAAIYPYRSSRSTLAVAVLSETPAKLASHDAPSSKNPDALRFAAMPPKMRTSNGFRFRSESKSSGIFAQTFDALGLSRCCCFA